MSSRSRRPRDRGSAALETVVLAVPLLALLGLAAAGLRVQDAKSAIEAAAYDAARAASISRTEAAAITRANSAAAIALDQEGVNCAGGPVVSVNTDGFNQPVGQPANVTVTVSCDVLLTDLGIGMDTQELTAIFVSPIDRYRSRQ
ncbi:MAG: hypothetical protein V7603_5089 [Micromonosporaceae bacterium]